MQPRPLLSPTLPAWWPCPQGKGVTTQVSHTGHTGGHHGVGIYTRIQSDFNSICIPQQASHQEVINECLKKDANSSDTRKQGMKTRYLCERLPFMLLKLTLVCMRSISRPRSTPVRPEGTLCTEALHWMGSTELSQATHHTLCTTTGADLGARQKKQGYESNPETQTLFFLLAAVTCIPLTTQNRGSI